MFIIQKDLKCCKKSNGIHLGTKDIAIKLFLSSWCCKGPCCWSERGESIHDHLIDHASELLDTAMDVIFPTVSFMPNTVNYSMDGIEKGSM